jgi:hypothetical protein
MENIIPHLNKHFFFVCEGMLAYADGTKVRKNRRFLKALWHLLREQNAPTVEDVIERMGDTVAENTKRMIKSNIKRGGWRWLEGADGNVFGGRFVDEYVRRCGIIETNELLAIAGRMIHRVNHHNYPYLYPTTSE